MHILRPFLGVNSTFRFMDGLLWSWAQSAACTRGCADFPRRGSVATSGPEGSSFPGVQTLRRKNTACRMGPGPSPSSFSYREAGQLGPQSSKQPYPTEITVPHLTNTVMCQAPSLSNPRKSAPPSSTFHRSEAAPRG